MSDICMVVSVALSMIGFLTGSGLIWSGAFFVWRLVGRNDWGAMLVTVLPAGMVTLFAAASGYAEMVMGMILGTVAINLALMGLVNFCFNERLPRNRGLLPLLWMAFGWAACALAGPGGALGQFGGLALMAVGLIAIWPMLSTVKQPAELQRSLRVWRWGGLILAVVMVGAGAWCMVGCSTAVAAVLPIPDGVFGAVVLAPICGLAALFGIRCKGLQAGKVLHSLTWANVILSSVGLGLAAVMCGGLPITQGTRLVTLPWVSGLVVLSAVAISLPQKTARWCGGLLLVLYLGYVISLLW